VQKPIVDGLEQELGDRLRVIHINIQETAGRELAQVYHFEYTPTYVFFDAQGTELWRMIGEIDPQRVRASLGP